MTLWGTTGRLRQGVVRLRIAVISPPGDWAEFCRRTIQGHEEALVLETEGDPTRVFPQLRKLEVGALISRGLWAGVLRRTIQLPVVAIEPTAFDLVTRLAEARKISAKTGIIYFSGEEPQLKPLEEALELEIRLLKVARNISDLRRALADLARQGIGVVIGGEVTVSLAREFRLRGLTVTPGREALLAALETAREFLRTGGKQTRSFLASLDLPPTVKEEGEGLAFPEVAAGRENLVISEPEGPPVAVAGQTPSEVKGSSSARQPEAALAIAPSDLQGALLAPGLRNPPFLNRELLALLEEASRSPRPLILFGERGVGKDFCAEYVHRCGERRVEPFLKFVAGLDPEEGFWEGESGFLDRVGRGTLVLEGLERTSEAFQQRLIRLSERKKEGARLIATFRTDARAVLERGLSRDLFDVLNGVSIRIPPLRERLQDIPVLLEGFLARKGRGPLNPAVLGELASYHWPGNVRELETFVEHLSFLGRALPELPPEVLEKRAVEEWLGREGPDLIQEISVTPGRLEEMEREIIRKMQRALAGNKSELARRLGVSRTTLWKKLKG